MAVSLLKYFLSFETNTSILRATKNPSSSQTALRKTSRSMSLSRWRKNICNNLHSLYVRRVTKPFEFSVRLWTSRVDLDTVSNDVLLSDNDCPDDLFKIASIRYLNSSMLKGLQT